MTIRPARPADIDALARLLARAFKDDPYFGWIVRGGEDRVSRLAIGFETILRHDSAGLSATYVAGDLDGVAVWCPPGYEGAGLLRQLTSAPRWAACAGWSRLPRVWAAATTLARARPDVPHYRLSLLAVEPARQGKGLGAALLEPVLARCDRDLIVASLKTANERTIRFYERCGFEVVRVLRPPAGAPPVWLLNRLPIR